MLQKIFLSLLVALLPSWTCAKLRIVTTTQDLASIAGEVAGDLAEVEFIAKGYQDPHFVEAKPSYLLKLKRANLFIQVGLELEVAWAPVLLTNARNRDILPGNPGFLDASTDCEILQKPSGRVDRSMGDVHPLGNPHYWLDTSNGRTIAKSIAARLSDLDPSHASEFRENLARFEERLADREKAWEAPASRLKGLKVITYHNSWPNFTKRFKLEVVNFIEPKPGIPASPAHLRLLMDQIKADKIPLLLMEPYFDQKLPDKIARDTGATLIVFPTSVGAKPEIKTYFDLFDYQIKLLREAIEQRGAIRDL